MRGKLKGDCLVGHGKYVDEFRFTSILWSIQRIQLGGQFAGSIFNNMGCSLYAVVSDGGSTGLFDRLMKFAFTDFFEELFVLLSI